ncbi:Hypothetical predicted protein [Mytilus galloprovincialis]|uniref:Uncharacterized protein n=1 Tax=Mytilus galloprovincialis TaxID=29158 RepID=A0A8B6F930_MYTGA|nr:Hypothetical predicted protein [Mytilus galloprovincialis]
MREGRRVAPFILARSLKKNQYPKKGVKRRLITEDKENDQKMKCSQTDLFLQDFPWSGGDERGEESSPIYFGTVFKEEPISGVKRFYEVDSSRESLLLSPEEKKKSPREVLDM